jgi:hypothetical protein
MSTLPNIILPTAMADLFASDASATFPGKPDPGGEPFDNLMARALLNPAGNQSRIAGQNTDSPKTDADNLPSGSAGLKAPAQTTGSPAGSTAARANVNFFAGNVMAARTDQSGESDGSFDYLMSRAPWAATKDESSVARENISRNQTNAGSLPLDLKAPQAATTIDADNFQVGSKSSKPATQASNTSSANTAAAANVSPLSGDTTAAASQTGSTGGQFDYLITSKALPPVTVENPVTSQNYVSRNQTNAGSLPLDLKAPQPAAQTAATIPPSAAPAANVGLVSSSTITPVPGDGSGQLDQLATHRSLKPADKSLVTTPNLNRAIVDADNFQVGSKNSKPAAQALNASAANTAAANVSPLSGDTTAAASQTGNTRGQFDYLITSTALPPATVKNPVTSQNYVSRNQTNVGSLPLDLKGPQPTAQTAATIPQSVPQSAAPAANVGMVSSSTIIPVPGKPGNDSGQLNQLATPNLNRATVDTDNFQVGSKSSKPATPVSSASSTNTAAANVSPLPGDTTAAISQTGGTGGQFDYLITSTALPTTTVKNPSPVTSQNLNPGNTAANNAPLHSKDSKSVAQTPDTSHSQAVSSPDNADNPSAQPEINNATINAANIAAQILAPMAMVDPLNVKTPANVRVAGKPAGNLPALSRVNNIPASPTTIPSPAIPENHPRLEASSTVQTDDRKNDALFSGPGSSAKNNATDSKTAALTPMAGQTSPAANEVSADSKTPKPTTKPAEDSPQTGLPALPVLDTKMVASAQSIGTPTAQQDELMNSGGKSSKTADLTGKILPGSVAVVARGNDLPLRADQITATTAASAAMQNNPATTTVSAASPVENVSTEDLRSQALEQTHDLVTAHAMRLSDTGTDSSLQVVIKPGAGTQLSLELRQRGNGVEAQAALQQGDFKHLSQHWPELQQRLEQRGIRLAPLTDDGSFANSNGQTFNQKQNQAGEAAAEMAFTAPLTGTFTQPITRVKAPGGWETWA